MQKLILIEKSNSGKTVALLDSVVAITLNSIVMKRVIFKLRNLSSEEIASLLEVINVIWYGVSITYILFKKNFGLFDCLLWIIYCGFLIFLILRKPKFKKGKRTRFVYYALKRYGFHTLIIVYIIFKELLQVYDLVWLHIIGSFILYLAIEGIIFLLNNRDEDN